MPDRSMVIGRALDGSLVGLSEREVARHVFLCGSTGSGKTSTLLSVVANALSWGSGLLFVDGKGDRDALAGVTALAARYGRADDVLVLDLAEGAARAGRSHRMNPFADGSAQAVTAVLTDMMQQDSRPQDGMWSARAVAMVAALTGALVSLRDAGALELDAATFRSFLPLSRVIDLADEAKFPEVSDGARRRLLSYLDSIPGYVRGKGHKQHQTCLDQHGFLQMQVTRAADLLVEGLGGALAATVGDVDLLDVVSNRRILVLLLPMAGQSAAEARALGGVAVNVLKGLLAVLASGRVPRRPGDPPFLALLDEFAQYVLPGTEGVVMLARSLGMSLFFATQSLTAPPSADGRSVLDHVLSNTGTKVLMRTDKVDTWVLGPIVPGHAVLGHAVDVAKDAIDDLRDERYFDGTVPRKREASQVARFEAMRAERRTAKAALAEAKLEVVLPGLPPGGMIVVGGGRQVRARSFDMSGLYGAPPDPVLGVGLTTWDRTSIASPPPPEAVAAPRWDPSTIPAPLGPVFEALRALPDGPMDDDAKPALLAAMARLGADLSAMEARA